MQLTIPLFFSIYIMFVHLIGDFGCQTREMANNKSKSIYWLTMHILAYGGVLTLGGLIWCYFSDITLISMLYFLATNMVCHWVTDFFTSKGTSYFWAKSDVHKFFCVIGFDQFIHASTLLLTIHYFLT